MEMEGREDEGIEFMSKTVENWKVRIFFLFNMCFKFLDTRDLLLFCV